MPRLESLDQRQRLALRVLLALIGICGALLSIYLAREETRQYRTLERLRIGETIDANFVAVSEHILARVSLARAVARFFVPPPLSQHDPLRNFGKQALSLASDLTTVGWLPEVEPARATDALASLAASGIDAPAFRGPDGKLVDPEKLDRPLYPIIDIAPPRNRSVLGVDAGSFPDRLAAIREARDSREVTRTKPLRLVQSPEASALLLYAPIFAENERFLGVMGFGFKIDEFFKAALATAKVPAGASVSIYSHDIEQPLYSLRPDGTPSGADAKRPTTFERKMDFGRADLTFVYSVPRDLARDAFLRGLWVALLGLAITAGAVLLLGYIISRAAALSDEVAQRRSAEDRLKVLIHELNHRVRNVMSVAQAVVRLSFTPGLSLADIQKTCEGRLQALAKALSMLTATDWRSVGLLSLISEDILPFAGRIEVDGPDIALRARSAQTFALLFYELATNAAKHGALSVPGGKVELRWYIDNLGSDPLFHLIWKESGGPPVDAPQRRGFGELLVRRIAPRDVGGKSEVRYAAEGFEYELEAPLRELIDTPAKAAPPRTATLPA
jgi:two-component sensor histidine kinase/CHASE1-domain containing sensor protein